MSGLIGYDAASDPCPVCHVQHGPRDPHQWSATPQKVFDAMLTGATVQVRTETRRLAGRLFEVGISPWDNSTRGRLVDDEGRVHYFRIERAHVDVAKPYSSLPHSRYVDDIDRQEAEDAGE